MIFGICSTRGLIIRLACAHKIATRYQHLAALCRPVGAMSFLGLMTAGQCCSDWKSDGRARLVRGSTAGANSALAALPILPAVSAFFHCLCSASSVECEHIEKSTNDRDDGALGRQTINTDGRIRQSSCLAQSVLGIARARPFRIIRGVIRVAFRIGPRGAGNGRNTNRIPT